MMSSTHMYGVVLWTSAADKKAVIWCEDHGNLAFYSGTDQSALGGMRLDEGDLIQFDMNEESDLRQAHNPQLVCQSHSTGIARQLRPGAALRVTPFAPGRGATVIYLDRFARARRNAL